MHSYSSFIYDDIKRKVRKLKKLEVKIRYGGIDLDSCPSKPRLVWDEFFSFSNDQGNAKYSLLSLYKMDKDDFKLIVDEFFFNVYYRYYRENGIFNVNLYDPDMLARLGLPYDADQNTIKARFRELAKKYHPDTGGDSEKFIELMNSYKKLF